MEIHKQPEPGGPADALEGTTAKARGPSGESPFKSDVRDEREKVRDRFLESIRNEISHIDLLIKI